MHFYQRLTVSNTIVIIMVIMSLTHSFRQADSWLLKCNLKRQLI